jgi:hypothetical protein
MNERMTDGAPSLAAELRGTLLLFVLLLPVVAVVMIVARVV